MSSKLSTNDKIAEPRASSTCSGPRSVLLETTWRRRRDAMVLGAIGLLAIVRLRMNCESTWQLCVELTTTLLVLLAALWQLKLGNSVATKRATTIWLLTVVICMPFVLNTLFRIIATGASFELTMMTMLGWGALCASTFGVRQRTINMSVVASGFLTLFATFCADDKTIALAIAFAWLVICLGWIVLNDWERAGAHQHAHIERPKWLLIPLVASGAIVFAAAVLLTQQLAIHSRAAGIELMPTSGGTGSHDKAARSGVGNGDLLVAAKNHATSFGAVESDQFLDSDQPTLFDMYSDTFGEPFTKKNFERAIALAPQSETSQPEKVAEAKSSGSSFTTERTAQKKPDSTRDVDSRAILRWIGRSPAHLAVERFSQFDGTEWHASSSSERSLLFGSKTVGDEVWYGQEGVPNNSIFAGSESEAIKFTGHRSQIVPTLAGVSWWNVPDVNQADFFELSADGILRMPHRETVPDYTIINFVNREIHLENVIRTLSSKVSQAHSHDQLGNDHRRHPGISRAIKLADEWTAGVPKGWPEVSTIIDHLRANFQHDRSVSFADDQRTSLEKFIELRRGSDVLFATMAAVILQSRGYETRFVTGFYHRSRFSLQTTSDSPIYPEDLHAWVELKVGSEWIPLEPTPGYEPPTYRLSWKLYVQRHAWTILIATLACVSSCVLVWLARLWLFDTCTLCGLPLIWLMSDRLRVRILTSLLDMRCWLAGLPRPRFAGQRDWVLQCLDDKAIEARQLIRAFFDGADAIWFGNANTMQPAARTAGLRLILHVTSRRLSRGFKKRRLNSSIGTPC